MLPALLLDASYYGTLAAARSLGRAGIDVAVGASERLAPAAFSRYVTRRLRVPVYARPDELVAALLAFGAAHGRHALLPTSDEACFLLALHGDRLKACFDFAPLDAGSVMSMLDKGRLHAHARAVGIETPATWLPENADDAERAANEASLPLVVKPRTQILGSHVKGSSPAKAPSAVRAAYARFVEADRHSASLTEAFPDAARPMLQEFHATAAEDVYSLAGFVSEAGEMVVLGARKVLQRPRRMGIGLCFEVAPVDEALAERARALCLRVGHAGVVELEFIRAGGRALLIDMNPRFYGQMALDIARGLPLAELAYAQAVGDATGLSRLLARARHAAGSGARAFCNGFGMRVMLGAQRAAGRLSSVELARWMRWRRDREGALVDAVFDASDPRPMMAEVAATLGGYARHPRSFVRAIVLDT